MVAIKSTDSSHVDKRREHILSLIHSRKEEKANRIARIKEACIDGDVMGIEFKHAIDEKWGFITPEMSDLDLGKYRTQLFDEKGFFTHKTFATLDEAILDLAEGNFVIKTQGALDHLSVQYKWTLGTMSAKLISQANKGLMTLSEANAAYDKWKLDNPDPSETQPTPGLRMARMRP